MRQSPSVSPLRVDPPPHFMGRRQDGDASPPREAGRGTAKRWRGSSRRTGGEGLA